MPKVSSCLYLCLCSAGIPKTERKNPSVVAANRHSSSRLRQVLPRSDDDVPLPDVSPRKDDVSPRCRRRDEAWRFSVEDDVISPSWNRNDDCAVAGGGGGRVNHDIGCIVSDYANPSIDNGVGRHDNDTSGSSNGISPGDSHDAGCVNRDASRSAVDADPTIDDIGPPDDDISDISDDICPSDDDKDNDDAGYMSDDNSLNSEDVGQMNVDDVGTSIDSMIPIADDVILSNDDAISPKDDSISPSNDDDDISPNNDDADQMNDDVSPSIHDIDPNNDDISHINDDDSLMNDDLSPINSDVIPGKYDLISSNDDIISSNEYAGLLPGLPDDVAMLCLGRVARSCLASMPLVCHSWRQLCLSPEYPRLRLQVGSSESWIHVLTEAPTDAPFKAFNPQTNKWYDLPPTPGRSTEKSWEGFACVAVGPLLLLMGGVYGTLDPNTKMFTRESVTTDVKIYNACTNQWSSGASMNTPRSWFAASVVEDRVYVAGGQGRTCFLSSAEVYDPRKNEWSLIPGMICVRSSCYGATLDNHFWVIGGEYMRNQYGDRLEKGSAEVYDPQSCSWKLVPEMWLDLDKVPGPNTLYEDKLLFVHRSKLMLYSKETNEWSYIGNLHNGIRSDCSRYGFACENIDGNIYIIGGNLEYRGYNFRNYVLPVSSVEVCNLRSQGQSKFLRWNNLAGMSDAEGAVLASAVVRL